MKNPTPAHRRHDLSDEAWSLLEPHLPGRKGGAGLPKTTASLSMRCCGFCVRVRRGGICRRTTGGGAIRMAALCAGGTRVFGKSDWKS